MFKLQFTSQVVCFDGVERTFVQEKFFAEKRTLDECLAFWDGSRGPGPNHEPYRYFVTPLQHSANAIATRYQGYVSSLDYCHVGPMTVQPAKDEIFHAYPARYPTSWRN
jgi:hypothetical protein